MNDDPLPEEAFEAVARLQKPGNFDDPWSESSFRHLHLFADSHGTYEVVCALRCLAVALAAAGHAVSRPDFERGEHLYLDGHLIQMAYAASTGVVWCPEWRPAPEAEARLLLVLRPDRVELYVTRPTKPVFAGVSFTGPPAWLAGGTLCEGIAVLRQVLQAADARRRAAEAASKATPAAPAD